MRGDSQLGMQLVEDFSAGDFMRIGSCLGARSHRLIEEALARDTVLHLGIMGGTFDPIHWGHLVTAQYAYEQFGLDLILFMVTGDSYQKRHRQVTSAQLRCQMVEAAISDNQAFELCTLELSRSGESYTVDTLKELNAYAAQLGLKPGENFMLSFITGADVVFDMNRWKNPRELCSYADIIAATRPSYQLVQAKDEFVSEYPACDIKLMEVPALAISSSFLRQQCLLGRSIRYLTDSRVIELIQKEGIYTDDRCL